MHAVQLYSYLYRLLDAVTPLNVDCGRLCNGACCKGDSETGMYLFPYEELMYNNEPWLKILDSDFIFNGKPVKIAICDGTCERDKRPLSCRIFPLFEDANNNIVPDIRGIGLCPLVTAKIPFSQYDREFLKNVKKVFNVLDKFRITKQYVAETKKIIEEYI